MDKNQPYFDPYNFNMPNAASHGGPNLNMAPPEAMMPGMEPVANPAMYYEQQYMYYKYLTQMLEYKMKLKEFEKSNREGK